MSQQRGDGKHLESASTSHRGAASSLLDQSELDGSFRLQSQSPAHLQATRHHGDKRSPHECHRQKRASTLSQPPPRTVEQPQACSISRSLMAAFRLQSQSPASQVPQPQEAHQCQRQRRARFWSPPPPRTVEQPQACSISRSLMAAFRCKANHLQVSCLCSSGKHSRTRVPEAETSTLLGTASAWHHGAAASSLDQSELDGGLPLQSQSPACVSTAWRRQALSTRLPQAETSKHL